MRDILRVAQLPVSLEKPVGDEDESELGDFVADDAVAEPFEEASEHLQQEGVRKALDALPERERQVIELRYGLTGLEPLTLEEVGQHLRRHPRADPPDREQHAEEAAAPARGADAARSRLTAAAVSAGSSDDDRGSRSSFSS